MKTSKRLQPIADFQQAQEKEAGTILANARARLENARKQLDDLQQYRLEYRHNLNSNGVAGVSSAALQDYQSFINSLNHAITVQEQSIRQLEAEFEERKRQWLAIYQKSKALDKFIDHSKQVEERLDERRQQKEIEDSFNRKINKNS